MNIKRFLQRLGWYHEPAAYHYQPDERYIELLNFWAFQQRQDIWLYQFVLQHFSDRLSAQNSLMISSVFGPRKAIAKSKSRVKLFYTGENIWRFPEYSDHCLSDVDLALGFDDIHHERYIRFPIWIFYFFGVQYTEQDIQQALNRLCLPPPERRGFCSLVCSHDSLGIRTRLYRQLSRIDRVDSAGSYLNNTDALLTRFHDDKVEFLRHYRFNICPENSNRPGYVTEKIFQAIRANTIPIYWGSKNQPEPEVLNHDAILFYEGRSQLRKLIDQVAELYRDERKYQEFIAQPRFVRTAAGYIAARLDQLRTKLAQLL